LNGVLPVLVLGAAMAGCAGPDQSPREAPPNLILISIDTLRSDHLGCYGYARDGLSPNIDRLAREGVVFENAISTSSWTLPAHASMLTGLYPAFHALQDDGVKLPPGPVTLAESLRASGYRTFAVVSHVYVSSRFGLERGFDEFDDSLIAGGNVNPIAEPVLDRFLGHLERELVRWPGWERCTTVPRTGRRAERDTLESAHRTLRIRMADGPTGST
jgi:hypothetical protein